MTILSTLLDVSYGTSTVPSCFCGAQREEVCECGEWKRIRAKREGEEEQSDRD